VDNATRITKLGPFRAQGIDTGAYHASKWALEGMSQSLAQEVGAAAQGG
jgi:NAD(P)-dependent dehydrogenase (short-subunit alcohol dehydrogenase family)